MTPHKDTIITEEINSFAFIPFFFAYNGWHGIVSHLKYRCLMNAKSGYSQLLH